MIRRYRIPTQRHFFMRLLDQRPAIVAIYVAAAVALIIINVEKF